MSEDIQTKYTDVIEAVAKRALLDIKSEGQRAHFAQKLTTQENEDKGHIRSSVMATGIKLTNVVPVADMDTVVDLTYKRILKVLEG